MSRFTPRSGVALLTCAVALTVALVSASTGCESGQYLAPGHIWVPCFRPPKCASGTAALTNFTLANATAPMPGMPTHLVGDMEAAPLTFWCLLCVAQSKRRWKCASPILTSSSRTLLLMTS